MQDAGRKLKLLFLCTGNSCRSQMAEGWCRELKRDCIEPYSAGVSPGKLDPRAVMVMAEAGVDMSSQSSKDMKELLEVPFDWVVTVCDNARQSCPVFRGTARKAHVGFDDPPALAKGASSDEEAFRHYRRIRDEIRAFVETLPGSLEEAGS